MFSQVELGVSCVKTSIPIHETQANELCVVQRQYISGMQMLCSQVRSQEYKCHG